MATKAVQLKKRLIKESVIFTVVLLLLSAGAYEVSDYDDQTLSENQNQQNENNRLKSENDAIQAQLSSGSEVSNFYDSYVKNHNSNFALNREEVTQLIAVLREKNHLINMSVTVSPITEVSGVAVPLKSGKLVQSEIKLNFNALTDNSVFAFTEALQRQLPGVVLVHNFSLNKNGELTPDIVRELSKHKLNGLVTAEIAFTWLGIRTNEPPPDANKGAPHAP